MTKYYEKNGEQVSGEVVNGQLITTMTVGGVVVSNPLITDIESDGWVEYTPIPAGSGNVQVTPADWSALITTVNQLTGSELVYSDTAPDITTAITALRNGVTFANVAKWWSLPTLLSERVTIITAISDGTVDTVGDYAFQNATALMSVNLPNATTIGKYAFANIAPNYLNLSNHITSVDQYAFYQCTLPAHSKFESDSLIEIKNFSFHQSGFEYISLPNATVGLGTGNNAFSYSPNLKALDLSSFYNNLGSYTLASVSTLQFIVLGGICIISLDATSADSSLYAIHYKCDITTSCNFSGRWKPTIGFSTTDNSIVPQQPWDIDENGDPIDCSQFTTNADKALWCFKHLFMPAFKQVTSATLTLHSTVYDVVTTDQDVLDYFSLHNWTLARVA